jgi:hypothetical protein
MTAKIEIDEEEFTLFVDKGIDRAKIANHFGVSLPTIDRRMLEFRLRSKFWVGDKPKAQDILEQIHLNKTSKQIADHFGMTETSFNRHCKDLELPYLNRTQWKKSLWEKGLAYCSYLEQILPIDHFHMRSDRKNQPHSVSKKGYVLKKQAFKKKIVDMFGGKCDECGYDECMEALVFHHIDPSKKDIAISKLYTFNERTINELSKCRLMCCNCHAKLHFKLKLENK